MSRLVWIGLVLVPNFCGTFRIVEKIKIHVDSYICLPQKPSLRHIYFTVFTVLYVQYVINNQRWTRALFLRHLRFSEMPFALAVQCTYTYIFLNTWHAFHLFTYQFCGAVYRSLHLIGWKQIICSRAPASIFICWIRHFLSLLLSCRFY